MTTWSVVTNALKSIKENKHFNSITDVSIMVITAHLSNVGGTPSMSRKIKILIDLIGYKVFQGIPSFGSSLCFCAGLSYALRILC